MKKCAYLYTEEHTNNGFRGNTYLPNPPYTYKYCRYGNNEIKFSIENECSLKKNLIETTNDKKDLVEL